jgi:hypothetical protein
VLEHIKAVADKLRARGMTPTRRWRADLPLFRGRCSSVRHCCGHSG